MARVKSVERFIVASRSEISARKVCGQVGSSLVRPIALCATTGIREAIGDADVVVTATSIEVDSDLVCATWLKEDAIVCSPGSYREVDFELVSGAWIVVHDFEHVQQRRGDLREGGIGWGRVAGDVASLTAGQLNLPGHDKRIYVIVGRIGALDVALGSRALASVRRKGGGVGLS
ncbi:hypothetical protein [Bradyrhizobium acaciae]|uniref:hypothetical protein n=1 Tax=Bradyrhizobium acaciae TaxID=2683706 RepID=UPI00237A84EE|nr:hypothetical protein [Bradyrhizobium acaciae]